MGLGSGITIPSLGNCNACPAKREISIVYKLGRLRAIIGVTTPNVKNRTLSLN
jgi:hypothetical protein